MNSQITFFDRHANMDNDTETLILKTITRLEELEDESYVSTITNWLYGSIDGFNYSKIAIDSDELNHIIKTEPKLAEDIINIFKLIDTYANNKTALTELIEKLESEIKSYNPNVPIYKYFIEEAKILLEKEKQQIIDAYEDGAIDYQGTNKRISRGDGTFYFEERYR